MANKIKWARIKLQHVLARQLLRVSFAIGVPLRLHRPGYTRCTTDTQSLMSSSSLLRVFWLVYFAMNSRRSWAFVSTFPISFPLDAQNKQGDAAAAAAARAGTVITEASTHESVVQMKNYNTRFVWNYKLNIHFRIVPEQSGTRTISTPNKMVSTRNSGQSQIVIPKLVRRRECSLH